MTTTRTSSGKHPVRSLISRSDAQAGRTRTGDEDSEAPETAAETATENADLMTSVQIQNTVGTTLAHLGKADSPARVPDQPVDADILKEREDQAMSFLEGAEGSFSYHQAALIRLACRGLTSEAAFNKAQYVLDRAKAVAHARSATMPIENAFNDYIMDFVENEAWHLSYFEADIIRRTARGCNSEELREIQYLLDRARKAQASAH